MLQGNKNFREAGGVNMVSKKKKSTPGPPKTTIFPRCRFFRPIFRDAGAETPKNAKERFLQNSFKARWPYFCELRPFRAKTEVVLSIGSLYHTEPPVWSFSLVVVSKRCIAGKLKNSTKSILTKFLQRNMALIRRVEAHKGRKLRSF